MERRIITEEERQRLYRGGRGIEYADLSDEAKYRLTGWYSVDDLVSKDCRKPVESVENLSKVNEA